MDSYAALGSAINLEAIALHPKREGETIKDVFFKTERSFSYHSGHEEFIISSTPVDCTLIDFLNFITNADYEDKERTSSQYLFLREFIGSYKGLESGKEMSIGESHPGIAHLEPLDRSHFGHLGLAYCNADTIIYEEAQISGSGSIPNGTIDLVALSERVKYPAAVAIHCCIGKDFVQEHECCIATAATIKKSQSYSAIESDRQAIVEL